MKGYLKTKDGIFQLAPKVTTVGREGCDLVIQTPGVDFQHAIIECSEQEDCFVLQDLNTTQGTYVNDCRVQNAAVRLAPGDIIRFGFSGQPHELDVETQHQHVELTPLFQKQVSYPPVQRAAWAQQQPITVISDSSPPQMVINDQGLPHLRTTVNTTVSGWLKEPSSTPGAVLPPRPPAAIRTRPLSASAATRKPNAPQPNPVEQKSVTGSGWVSTGASPARTISATQQQANDVLHSQEKEQRVLLLENELRRLAPLEAECARKEEVLTQLRMEIQDLHNKIRSTETVPRGTFVSDDAELAQKLLQLENEVSLKKIEVQSLKEQIQHMRNEKDSGSSNREQLNDRILEVNSLRTELERVRKDKNITSGLVTQMQKDMTDKDTTISRLTRDLEAVKKEAQEKDSLMTSLNAKFTILQGAKKVESEDLEAKTKELLALRQKFKSSESQLQEQAELIASLKEELDKVGKQASEVKENHKQVQGEVDQLHTKCQDFERAERCVRVDLEQASKKLERFRNKVLQTAFSIPGIHAPDKELNDDEVIETLHSVITEMSRIMAELKETKEKMKSANNMKREFVDNTKKLKQPLLDTADQKAGDSKKK